VTKWLDRTLFTDWLESKIDDWDPAARRRMAVRILSLTFVGMIINVALYLFKVIGEPELILVTLVLSWVALQFTCIDMVATTTLNKEADST
jgi:hypothetical protein